MKEPDLIPPDPERCQGEVKNGRGPFLMSGFYTTVRCSGKPTVIATETKPGFDGRIGSMSLCADCKKRLIAGFGRKHATFKKIKV
jgi:hypothetical protein